LSPILSSTDGTKRVAHGVPNIRGKTKPHGNRTLTESNTYIKDP